MGSQAEVAISTFASGEVSPKLRGRYELPLYKSANEKMLNFVPEIQGPARFRSPLRFVQTSRRNRIGVLIPFQYTDTQAYQLEFTSGYMRVFKDNAAVTEANKTITGITQASPGVVTCAGHGFVSGDEIYLNDIGGMTTLNTRTFLVVYIGVNTFSLTDVDGNAINTSALSAYTSGGRANKIYEITTPYLEADDLFQLRYAQNFDTMTFVHPYYDIRDLTRSGHTSWTLARQTRTADPFLIKKNISAVTLANPCKVTAVAHGYSTGDTIIIEEIVGTTQLNSRWYTITKVDADNFTLDGVNSSAYTAWSSAGFASDRKLLPSVVAYYESRRYYGASALNQQTLWGSRAPDSAGLTRYNDFTTGTNADNAVIFTYASKKPNKFMWMEGNNKFLAVGTFSGEVKVTGSPETSAISPSSITMKPVSAAGSEAQVAINRNGSILFMERGKRTLRSFDFDVLADNYVANDRNETAEHITEGNLKQIFFQAGRPDIVWGIKEDGMLIGLTYKTTRGDTTGWHRYGTASGDKFLCGASISRPSNFEQAWFMTERIIGGVTRRYIEYLEDQISFPEPLDYFTGRGNEDADRIVYLRALYETQKSAFHADSAISYDGTSAGSTAGATVTPAAVTGTGIVFTASAAVFTASMVGREIRKKPILGVGTGRAVITAYTDSTHVVCTINVDFDVVTAMAAGNWYLTTASLSGLNHLEGRTVKVIADGAVQTDKVVASGAIALDYQAGRIHVGLGYFGYIKSMDLEYGGVTGPAQTKNKRVNRLGLKFLNTLGAKYGTDIYNLAEIDYRSTADNMDRPPPLFSGVLDVPYSDRHSPEKHVMIYQESPLPCTVLLIEVFGSTSGG